jgi:hypothetical protein
LLENLACIADVCKDAVLIGTQENRASLALARVAPLCAIRIGSDIVEEIPEFGP